MRCNSSVILSHHLSTIFWILLSVLLCCSLSSAMLHRLGHPVPSILATLRQNHFIFCNKLKFFFSHSYPFGKHTKLPFTSSVTSTHFPFDIVHSDIWTSPVPSYDVINIMCFFLITSLIFCGLFLYLISLKCLLFLFNFMLILLTNLIDILKFAM